MEKREFLPLTTGQVLDEAFRLYRAHFVRLITIAAIGQIPIALLVMSGIIPLQLQGLTALAALPAGMLLAAALQKAVAEFYLGGDISVGAAYRFIFRRFFRVLWASILFTLLIMLGSMCLVAPGVLFAIWFCLTIPLIVTEDLTTWQAMSRSKALVAGNLLKVLVIGIAFILISWIIQFLCVGLGMAAGYLFLGNERGLDMLLVQQFSQSVGQMLTAPFTAGWMMMLYYDMRIRKEGFDLEMLAQEMAGETEALPDGSAAIQ